jgi:hypothetical protein
MYKTSFEIADASVLPAICNEVCALIGEVDCGRQASLATLVHAFGLPDASDTTVVASLVTVVVGISGNGDMPRSSMKSMFTD